ncbi:MAG: transcription antitermination factor NusB [Nitriliruptorales bacterium]
MNAAKSTSSRHVSRRRALEILYEADVRRAELRATLDRARDDTHAEPLDRFARELVAGVADHLDEIDGLIERHARGWTVARMPFVDRNILRLGIHELLQGDTPPAVVIDEAVELAKDLSTEASPRYVNGVLSAVLRDRGPDG